MTRRTFAAMTTIAVVATLASSARAAPAFSYEGAGKLKSGSGTGRVDTTVYAPGMRFPIESGPAYANSQVYNAGGGEVAGDQCAATNFAYPWRDNYCEKRSWSMPMCPSGTGHQGQDIRAASCEKDKHWVVATADGTITNVGTYSVYLTAPDGTRYDYLHMSNLQVQVGSKVTRGQRIGKVSNQFGGTPTTIHLHFNIKQNVSGLGSVYVPPYMSLVKSYEQLLGLTPATPIADAGPSAVSAPPSTAGTSTSPTEPEREDPTTTGAMIPVSPEDGEAETIEDAGCRASRAGDVGTSTATAGTIFGALLLVRRRRRPSSVRA